MRQICTVIALFLPQILNSEPLSDLDVIAAKATQFLIDDGMVVPPDPSNRFWANPIAIELGEALFFDTRLSSDGTVSCASCHTTDGDFIPNESIPAQADRKFRSVMPVAGAAFQDFLFWDGRADSLWAQALGPLENPSEHGLTRTEIVGRVIENYDNELFMLNIVPSDLPVDDLQPASPLGTRLERANWRQLSNQTKNTINQIFADVGKLIAAFEGTILPPATDFDKAVSAAQIDSHALSLLSVSALRGFELFSGRARCSTCHSGPLFSDADFHNTGMPQRFDSPLDIGRQSVVAKVKRQEFGCLGEYSDAEKNECPHVTYMSLSMERAMGTFRTPSLRQISKKTIYGHAGQFQTLYDVVYHYNKAPSDVRGNLTGQGNLSEILPLDLSDQDIADIVAFLSII